MLKPIELFKTPEDWDELMAWIDAHNSENKGHLMVAAAMAWNLAAKEQSNERME